MASIFHSQTLLLQCHNKIKWVGQIIISPSSCLAARETVALFSFKSLVKGKLKYYKWLIGVLSWAPWSLGRLGYLKLISPVFIHFSPLSRICSLQFWLDSKSFLRNNWQCLPKVGQIMIYISGLLIKYAFRSAPRNEKLFARRPKTISGYEISS